MKLARTNGLINTGATADRRLLINGLTLVALGVSVLFLNSWNTLFVRTSIGLFWAMFFVISNWSGLVKTLRGLKQQNDRQPSRSGYRSST